MSAVFVERKAVSSFRVRQSRDDITSIENSCEMVGLGKRGEEAWHGHNQEDVSSICRFSELMKEHFVSSYVMETQMVII